MLHRETGTLLFIVTLIALYNFGIKNTLLPMKTPYKKMVYSEIHLCSNAIFAFSDEA